MSDQDFDFHQPTQRRDAKRFEPPPWEAQAFEELQRKRQEQEARSPRPTSEVAEDDRPAEVGAGLPAKQPAREPSAPVQPVAEEPKQLDESVVVELLAGLAAEEPSIQPAVQRLSLVIAIFIAALGTVMILWGMAALVGSRTTGPMGAFGGAVLLFFGAVMIAGAVWLTVRTLRQRGVL